MGVSGQRHAPAALPPGKTRYPLYKRLVGPRAGLDGYGKSRTPPGFNPRTVQPVTSRYTDWAIAACTVWTGRTVNRVTTAAWQCWRCRLWGCWAVQTAVLPCCVAGWLAGREVQALRDFQVPAPAGSECTRVSSCNLNTNTPVPDRPQYGRPTARVIAQQ